MCIYIDSHRGKPDPSLNNFTKQNNKYKRHREYLSCPGHAVDSRYRIMLYLHALGFMLFSVHHMLQSLCIRVCITSCSLYVSQCALRASIYTNESYVFQPIDISTTNFTEIFFHKRLHTGS
jgi:hypothetical protein